MSKIRIDKNQRPYVIFNGGVYRPETGPHEYPIPQRNWGKGLESKIAIGAGVKVKQVNQSPFCKVQTINGVEEMWTVHGHDVKNPESCFFTETGSELADLQRPKNREG